MYIYYKYYLKNTSLLRLKIAKIGINKMIEEHKKQSARFLGESRSKMFV